MYHFPCAWVVSMTNKYCRGAPMCAPIWISLGHFKGQTHRFAPTGIEKTNLKNNFLKR